MVNEPVTASVAEENAPSWATIERHGPPLTRVAMPPVPVDPYTWSTGEPASRWNSSLIAGSSGAPDER